VAIVAAQVLQISQLDHPIRAALQPEKHICRLIIQGIKKRHPKNTGNSLGSQLSLRGDQKKPEMQVALHHPLQVGQTLNPAAFLSERFEISETL
jgi:hypothetical protein